MFEIPPEMILKGTLIFVRIGGILFFLPIFGDSPTPARVRVLLAAGLTFAFYNIVPPLTNIEQFNEVTTIVWALFKELLIGFTLGFITKIAFDGVLMAASLVGFQMGFGTANLFIPDAGQQLNSFTAFHRILMILIFLGMDLHHTFLQAISESFTVLHLGGILPQAGLGELAISLTASIFVVAIQLAAPVLVALLFTMAALGLAARTVPQLNVFTLSFPASFFIGLLVYMASLPYFPEWLQQHFTENQEQMFMALRGLKL
jgi:flagellar biosynthesis protein FliR